MKLWENTPGKCEEIPIIEYYPAENKKTKATVVIFPGGGYSHRAEHEGKGYAEMFNQMGMDAFVCQYRVYPHLFPLPLLDARRSVRWVRANAKKYDIDPERIAVIGSSAGGHLASMLSTYYEPIDFEGADEIDKECYVPNAQILCYPVIALEGYGHYGSGLHLFGEEQQKVMAGKFCTADFVTDKAPKAFIWHTAADSGVPVKNSLVYAEALWVNQVPVEMHIFPEGNHGLGCAPGNPHVAQWCKLLENWLKLIGFLAD